MAILFYNDIQKGNSKKAQMSEALAKLRSFLDTNEPKLAYFLQTLWHHQGTAITYKELREAILKGELDPSVILDWQKDYSRFVTTYMLPAWTLAMEEATTRLSHQYPLFAFDAEIKGVKEWIDTKAASFVTNSVQDQIDAINAVVGRASLMQDMTVDGLARAVRPMVGLTIQQANANLNFYNRMIESGVSEKKALEQSIKYSARQHRYRGYNIARTELSFAYNKGEHFGVEQAIRQGYMGHTKKTWCTAADERVCKVCKALEGKTIEMDEEFDFKTKLSATNPGIKRTPPAHPSCRCTVLYVEVEPPAFDTIEEIQ